MRPEDLEAYAWDLCWRNDDAGSVVHRLTAPGRPPLYVKDGPHLTAERDRLVWCAERLPVPEIAFFDVGPPHRLVTVALRGAGAHDRANEPDVSRAAAVLAEGCGLIHSLDPGDCPFNARTTTLLARATASVEEDPTYPVWDRDRAEFRPAADVLDELTRTRPEATTPVVVHGDAAVPNFIIDQGQLTGIVDVGDLGVGEQWLDIAACLASMGRPDNALAGGRDEFLHRCGVEPDPERERWFLLLYRLRWDLRRTT